MKPQITIEQLRRAIEERLRFLDPDWNVRHGRNSSPRVNELFGILDIIDNPEKYKHLWEEK